MKLKGETQDRCRAVDYEGAILESQVTTQRDRRAALKFHGEAVKRHGQPKVIVTDQWRSYGAGLKDLGVADNRETGRRANNRAETAHLPFRRRDRAMFRFRRMRSLQKLAAVHSSIQTHFNKARGLDNRDKFKANRTAAFAAWRGLGVAKRQAGSGKRRPVRMCLTPPVAGALLP